MQSVHRRLLTAGAILVGGTIGALPFYRQPQGTSSPALNSTPAPSFSDGKVPLQIPGTDAAPTKPPSISEAVTSEPVQLIGHPASAEREPEGLPPQLSRNRPDAEEPVPPATPSPRSAGHASSPGQESDGEPRQRRHFITDGDTLESLARRFLGDSSRWREIRDLNRDVITADDILPIGKELRIPPKENLASPAPATESQSTPGLVPVPWGETKDRG